MKNKAVLALREAVKSFIEAKYDNYKRDRIHSYGFTGEELEKWLIYLVVTKDITKYVPLPEKETI